MNPEDDFLLGPMGAPAPSGENRFMQSLLGEGDYSDSAYILPFAYSPEGEPMLSFPMAVQGLAQGVQAAGRLGGMVFEGMPIDLATGLPAQDVVDDVVEAGLTFTGGSLLAPRPSNSLGMGGRIEDMPLFQQIAKRPKSLQMPPAEEALYRAGAAMQLPRESGEGLLLPQRAYDLGAAQARVLDEDVAIDPGFQNIVAPFIRGRDADTVIRDLGTVMDSPDVSLQNLIGDTAKLMPGDMTMAGQEITHVMGVKLKNPVRMQGGKDFPAEQVAREIGLVWASDPAVISGYAKQARENPGLLGIYSAMGARSGDFSHHVADVVVDMTKQADWIPKSEIKRFDDEIRAIEVKNKDTGKVTRPHKDFPGILSDNVEDYLYEPGRGNARKAIADVMEKASYRKEGFPDLSVIRTVVADPDVASRVNDPSAMMAPTGGRIVRFDDDPFTPIGGEGNYPVFHKTYRQGITGEDLGALEMPVPRSLIFPEFFARRRAADKAMPSDRRSAEISNVLQTITPEIADDVDRFTEMYRRGLLGDVF